MNYETSTLKYRHHSSQCVHIIITSLLASIYVCTYLLPKHWQCSCLSIHLLDSHKLTSNYFSFYFIVQLIVVNSETMTSMSSSNPIPGVASVTAMEKSLLLALALKWRQQSDNLNTEQIQHLERDIWLSHIHSAVQEMENSVSLEFCIFMLIVNIMCTCSLSLIKVVLHYHFCLKWNTLPPPSSLSQDIRPSSPLSLSLHNHSSKAVGS